MTDLPEALTVCLALGTPAAAVLLPLLLQARRRAARTLAELEAAARDNARLTAEMRQLTAETRHLATARLPALISHLLHGPLGVPPLAHPGLLGSETDRDHRTVLDLVARAVHAERQRIDEAAQAMVRGTTTVLQAKSYQLQDRINEMQHRFDDPRVIHDTVALSRLNEQILRRVQATGVACGATAGVIRADSHLGDIVVGAQSRIAGLERVRVTSRLTAPLGVVARAVEPVAIAVTELLANAVHHSHATSPVEVGLHHGETGALVVVDDAGLGLRPEEIDYATRMVSGLHPVLITELGDPPRTGFAAIGRLSRQFGFTVSVAEAGPYGGVRAVVHIPGRLLTMLDETTPMSVAAPLTGGDGSRPHPAHPAEPAGPAPGAAGDPGRFPDHTGAGLPRRRRRAPRAPAPRQTPPVDAPGQAGTPAAAGRSPEEAGALWASFQRGTASGRAARDGRQPGPQGPQLNPDAGPAQDPADLWDARNAPEPGRARERHPWQGPPRPANPRHADQPHHDAPYEEPHRADPHRADPHRAEPRHEDRQGEDPHHEGPAT